MGRAVRGNRIGCAATATKATTAPAGGNAAGSKRPGAVFAQTGDGLRDGDQRHRNGHETTTIQGKFMTFWDKMKGRVFT